MVRIQKYLANIGLGSRRSIEELIKKNEVKLNGKICKVGAKVNIGDIILINGKKIIVNKNDLNVPRKMLLYHKPLGEVCSRVCEKGRKTVFDNLPKLKSGKWVSIGRLDINSSGLLLFTTDGDLANKFMHPSSNIEREYLVKVVGNITPDKIQKLLKGVVLEDGIARFKSISLKQKNHNNKWYRVVLTEGKNREVRRLFESQGLMVSKLIRIRFGSFNLPKNLKKGNYIYVEEF